MTHLGEGNKMLMGEGEMVITQHLLAYYGPDILITHGNSAKLL